MKKTLIALLLLLVFAVPAYSSPSDTVETLSVATTGTTAFTAAKIEDITKFQTNAQSAFCTVAVATINYTYDGTTPTTTTSGVGHKALAGTWFIITGHARLKNFLAIGETATSTVTCTYSYDY
jgi:uncharacterized membrane protein